MLVTLITDGSWCPRTKAAGYGYYVVSQRGRAHGGGSMMGVRESSLETEMCAAVNGIHFALKYGLAEKGDRLIVQVDSLGAIDRLRAALESPTGLESPPLSMWQKIVTDNELSITLRHVKGHVRPEAAEPRHYCNNVCDRHAREGMREARRQLEGRLCTPTTKAIA